MMNREGFLVSSMMSFVELQGGAGGCSNGHSQKHNASWDWETNTAAAAAGFQIPVPAAAASFQHQASLDFPPTLLPAPGGMVPFYAPAPEYSMGMVKREDYYGGGGGGGLGMGGGGGGGGFGLNLGRRTYFSPGDALAVERILARSRGAYSLMRHVAPRCQAEGCGADLSCAKHYHRRHKVCEFHAKAAVVAVAGLHQRFCQQCSRFHVLSEFDEAKRSCRKRLADHNRRRRKPQQPAVTSAASKTSSATNSSSKTKNVGAVKQVQKTSAHREKNSSSSNAPKSTSASLCTTMGQFQKQQRSSEPALSLGAVAAADQKSRMLRANYQAGAFVAVAKEKDSQQQQQLLHSFHNHHHSLLFSSSHEASQPTEVNQCRVNLGHAMFEDDYV